MMWRGANDRRCHRRAAAAAAAAAAAITIMMRKTQVAQTFLFVSLFIYRIAIFADG